MTRRSDSLRSSSNCVRRNSSSGTATPGPPSMTAGDIPEPPIVSLGSLCGGSAVVADAPFALGVCKASSQGRLVIPHSPGCDFVAMLQRPVGTSPAGQGVEHVICRLQIETYPARTRPQACENRKQLLPTASDGPSGLIRPVTADRSGFRAATGSGSNAPEAQKKLPESSGPRGAKDSSLFREQWNQKCAGAFKKESRPCCTSSARGTHKRSPRGVPFLRMPISISKRPAASMLPVAFAGPQTLLAATSRADPSTWISIAVRCPGRPLWFAAPPGQFGAGE